MLTDSYLVTTGRLPQMMTTLQDAGVPQRFTHEFLKSLGFKSTNDRAFIGVLKGINFLDGSGAPTELYKTYKNKSEARAVLGRALKLAYEDVFLANERANELSAEKLKGIFATKTGKGETVVARMAATFKSLASLADFSESPATPIETPPPVTTPPIAPKLSTKDVDFRYNIQIHLPVTKDISVYNAIFKSIRDHLL